MRGLFLAVFALLIVAGDSGRYAPQLIANALSVLQLPRVNDDLVGVAETPTDETSSLSHSPASQTTEALALLWLASKQGSEVAQSALLMQFEKAHEEQFAPQNGIEESTATYYLEKLVNLENADAAWLLYQILGEEGASQRFMRLAALGDVAEAQLAFAMSTESPEKREKWLIRAASQDYLPAQAALADWYLLHGQQALAKPLLAATATLDMQSAFKYARLLWDEGEYSKAKEHFQFAAKKGHLQAK